MRLASLPYVKVIPDRDGNPAWCYYRRSRRYIPIVDAVGKPILPGQQGFLLAYNKIAEEFATAPAEARRGTVAELVGKFRASAAFKTNIGAGSREQYGYHLRFLEERFGDLRAGKLTAERVADLLDTLQDTPRKANYLRATISRLWNFGRRYAVFAIKENPAEHVEKLKGGGEYRAWKDSEIATFLAKAPPMMRVACVLALYTGQRRSDIAPMLWSQYDGQAIEVVQQKTGNKAWIPADRTLRRLLDGHPRTAAVILTTQEGRPFAKEYLGKAFAKAVKALNLPVGRRGCHFHGLRKTAGVKLAEAGCTAHEIMAILGCSMQNAEHYCKEAAQKALAASGIAKREASQNAAVMRLLNHEC